MDTNPQYNIHISSVCHVQILSNTATIPHTSTHKNSLCTYQSLCCPEALDGIPLPLGWKKIVLLVGLGLGLGGAALTLDLGLTRTHRLPAPASVDGVSARAAEGGREGGRGRA